MLRRNGTLVISKLDRLGRGRRHDLPVGGTSRQIAADLSNDGGTGVVQGYHHTRCAWWA